MSFTSDLREKKEKEITAQLKKMLKDSRDSMQEEIAEELKGQSQELIDEIMQTLEDDYQKKLKQVPATVKSMFDEADRKADEAYNKEYK